jgi:hypothetical protein
MSYTLDRFAADCRAALLNVEPMVHNNETAGAFSAPVGSPAMLVRRWYFLDGETILLISRSIYPKGVLFRNELRRSEVSCPGSGPVRQI